MQASILFSIEYANGQLAYCATNTDVHSPLFHFQYFFGTGHTSSVSISGTLISQSERGRSF